MAEDRGKQSFAVEAVERIGVGVADSRRLDLDQDFTGLRPVQVKLDDLERLLCFECDSSARLHSQTPTYFCKCAWHLRGLRRHFLPMQEFSAWV